MIRSYMTSKSGSADTVYVCKSRHSSSSLPKGRFGNIYVWSLIRLAAHKSLRLIQETAENTFEKFPGHPLRDIIN